MANRRPPFKIPSVINPENRRCITFWIPDDNEHVEIFAGLTRQLLDWQRWERDTLKRGTQVAQVWREVWNSVDWSGEDCMGCCPEPTNTRYNSEGVYEESFDGGITWLPAPAHDRRYSGTIAPPLAGEDGQEKRCVAAQSAADFLKTAFIDDLSTGASYADLNAAAVAIVAALGVTGIGILIAAAAAAIFILGVSATQAAFTTEVWNDFKCILYCNMNPDASFDEAGWAGVKSDILDTFTGVVSAVLYNWANAAGIVGLTNAARSGFATEGDCSTCGCPSTCVDPSFVILGNIIAQDDFSITIESVPATRNSITADWIVYGSADDTFCCLLCDQSYEGFVSSGGWTNCDGVPQPFTSPIGQMIRSTEFYGTGGTFTATFVFAGEDGCPP